MNALVVVHAEHPPIERVSLSYRKHNEKLFSDIAFEISKAFQKKDPSVYFLAARSTSPYSRNLPKTFKPFGNKMAFIVKMQTDKQFLLAKELLMEHEAQSIDIAGISYYRCISDFYHLLVGEDGKMIPKKTFLDASKVLGWDVEQFEKIYTARLNVRIREELTDKVFS